MEFGRGKRDGPGGGARGPAATGQNRIYVEGLDNYTSWQDLKDFARRAGQPTFTDVFHDRGGKVTHQRQKKCTQKTFFPFSRVFVLTVAAVYVGAKQAFANGARAPLGALHVIVWIRRIRQW